MNKKYYALGRLKVGQMNKTEFAYELQLKALMQAGEIIWYRFEGMKFRLADNTYYTPDFNVMLPDGTLEHHEVKSARKNKVAGGKDIVNWEDDARVKIKVAAELFPFRFIAVAKKATGIGFDREIFE